MKIFTAIIGITLNIVCVQNREIPSSYYFVDGKDESEKYKVGNVEIIDLDTNYEDLPIRFKGTDDSYPYTDIDSNDIKKCAVYMIPYHLEENNAQETLLRRYRYNENGELIPSSVQYFVKVPKGKESTLVPLRDNLFSPSGLRYKSLPQIPHTSSWESWRRK